MPRPATYSKITLDHQRRQAHVYVRQSTVFQVARHRESTERQYNLAHRAGALGRPAETIVVLDGDQGHSAAPAGDRHGFQRLVAGVAAGDVGPVLMLEASRRARCGSDWRRLIELCSLSRTLIADGQAVYDPRGPNDRLLPGVRGTLSEAELMTLRTRLFEGRWSKARKGELKRSVPTGHAADHGGRWAKDPDRQVQDRLDYVFALYRRLGVARQVMLTLRDESLAVPTRAWGGPARGQLQWQRPTYSAIARLLNNPACAGAYVYGQFSHDGARRGPKTGKARGRVRPLEDWPACLQNHHEGYISWEEYLANRRRLRQNGFRADTAGAPRAGKALLQGIVWCGRCGAKMAVNSYPMREHRQPSYQCDHAYNDGARHICQSMCSRPVGALVVSLFLEALGPAQVKIALEATEQLQRERQALQRQWEQQLEQARHEARLAQRQYEAVDPGHRLVAAELERRWNAKLEALQSLERAYAAARREARFSIGPEERRAMATLARDLPAVWNAATTTDRERRQLLRHLIAEVQLDGVGTPGFIDIRIAWRSGTVTEHQVERIKGGAWAPRTEPKAIERVRTLAPTHTVAEIVADLNREGWRSACGHFFQDAHVLHIARQYRIAVTTVARKLPLDTARPGGAADERGFQRNAVM